MGYRLSKVAGTELAQNAVDQPAPYSLALNDETLRVIANVDLPKGDMPMPEVEAADATNTTTTPRSWLLMRPREVTMSMPVEFRWEFTRRHPYYLTFWQSAQRRHDQRSSDRQQRLVEDTATIILGGIGVAESMAPPDPSLAAEALGTRELGGAWVGGAVAPATFRTLAHMLLAALPAAQRSQLGRLLNESAEFDLNDVGQMAGLHSRLADLSEPEWDSFPKVPVISVNLDMPQRAVTEAVEALVRQWKEERGIAESRRRDDKLGEYLAVWDLREGWANGEYDARLEKTFEQIAQEIKLKVPTVVSRYRSAFRFLSGHEYSPELWIRLMGPLKLSRYGGIQAGQGLVMRRPWRSPNLRPVTEAVLLPGRREFESSEFLAAAGVAPSDIAWVDLAMDIETLLDQGKSDFEILEALELTPDDAGDLVADIRRRHESR